MGERPPLLIYNPGSGLFSEQTTPDDIDAWLRATLDANGAGAVATRAFEPESLDTLADELRQAPPSALWVAGGDGTVLSMAGLAAQLELPLGILPGGTMNLMARDLGMDMQLQPAIRQLLRASPQRIDMARVNDAPFLCIANLGMSTRLTAVRESLRGTPGWRRWPLIAWHTFTNTLFYPRYRLTLEIHGREHHLNTRSLSVSNNPLADDRGPIPTRPALDNGTLGVYAIRDRSRWSLPRLALRLLSGRWQADEDLVQHECEALTVRLRHRSRIRVMTDGELLHMTQPLRFETRPASLIALVPRGASEGAAP
ncbi:MAG: diacylglycerol/lipid kinase family protein [Gammaproteobacteria bacterium]